MRPPRYQFPEQVRATTRTIASTMASEGTNPATPEDLDQWLASRPNFLESLARGGYGTAFSAIDLHPLLLVFMGGAAPPSQPAAAKRATPYRLLIIGAVAIVALLSILLLM